PIFYNHSQNTQQDVSIQIVIATSRLGSNSNGAAVLRLKNLFQFGYGMVIHLHYNSKSTLHRYCDSIVTCSIN
ncbi:uncharacterized protein VP01_13234g1, partial [Puccinia sorghi]